MATITGGGKCIMGCTDWKTGKPRTVPLHSQTGICGTCLSALSRSRRKGVVWMAKRRAVANLSLRRYEEVQHYPKGYARLGGRPHGKR